MADVCKVRVEDEQTKVELHKHLKAAIDKKLDEKDWKEDVKDEYRRKIFKIYEDTVELSVRENVVVGKVANVVPEQEMEPLNKERAIEVNRMCAESEDLLTKTIKKRKNYPRRIKESLQRQHNAEFEYLCDLDKKAQNPEQLSETAENQMDMTSCDEGSKRFREASESLSAIAKSLSETRKRAEELRTTKEMFKKFKESDMHKRLFDKRLLTYESVMATPTNHDESISCDTDTSECTRVLLKEGEADAIIELPSKIRCFESS